VHRLRHDAQKAQKALRSSPVWLPWPALRQAAQAVARQDGERFADEYIESIERRYIDHLSLDVIEMRAP
jgi:hypothetical protein